jgi:NADH-quinone oxidoreductase subunit G
MIIVGQGALARPDGATVLSMAAKLANGIGAISGDRNGLAVLHTAAARVGGLDLGFVPEAGKTVADVAAGSDVLFLLGADELDMSLTGKAFTIYIGTHGDAGAHRADVILPGAAYTEKSGTYVNTEGRVQMANRAGFAPGEAREDWAVLRALSDVLGHRLPFDSLPQLRRRLYAEHPHFAELDQIAPGDAGSLSRLQAVGGEISSAPFISPIKDFYLTNPIARASAIMAECSALARGGFKQAAE